jgi:H+/gluconate symporter-like permease
VLGISPNPLISSAIATNVLAGITGSASGGMSIALATLGEQFMQSAQSAGIDPEIMHRVVALSSGGFDALPHNGAVITLLAITGLTHRQSYADIFVVAVIIPFTMTVGVILAASVAVF